MSHCLPLTKALLFGQSKNGTGKRGVSHGGGVHSGSHPDLASVSACKMWVFVQDAELAWNGK
jgi:hypothetical protein